jgi:hypothetical protein
MISNSMIANREYVDTYMHFNTKITEELIKTAEKLFRRELTPHQTREIHKMELKDKQWLLKQYKSDIKFTKEPDLDHLY